MKNTPPFNMSNNSAQKIDSEYLQASNAVKIRFPSIITKNCWAIEEYHKKTLLAVPFFSVLMTVSCANPIRKKDLFNFLASKISTKNDRLEKSLEVLLKNEIIFWSEKKPLLFDRINAWKLAGWDEAADYHFFTWNTPFLDYSKEGKGHEYDRKQMVLYQSLQSDVERFKEYTNYIEKIDLPNPTNSVDKRHCTFLYDKVAYMLSLTFGKKGEKGCHWSQEPLIKRTSPSGGCRHPVEGYFVSCGMEKIRNGLYHIQTAPPMLKLLSEVCDIQTLVNEIPNSGVIGFVIISTIVERNMYRYREPRTFRTIHMDAGHILTTLEVLGEEFGIKMRTYYDFDEKKILKYINAEKLDEGIMAVAVLYRE
jgi:SagB-type dehydrogenase family enzyme